MYDFSHYIYKIGNRIIIKLSKRQLNVVLLALVRDEILTQFHILKFLSEKLMFHTTKALTLNPLTWKIW